MASPRFPYCPVKRGNRFFQPTPELKALGFVARALGPDGPDAWEKAAGVARAIQKARSEALRVTTWPKGSFGSFYDHFKRTKAWARKSPRSREDYDRTWPKIEMAFARKKITEITVAECEDFDESCETLSPSERYRTIKCLKALLNAAVARQILASSPAASILNPQPKGRSQIWVGSEVATLIAAADAERFHGMAIAIRVAWDTMFSPVDVWTVKHGQRKRDREGSYIERLRTKTTKAAYGALSPETDAAIDAYVQGLPFELTSETPLIRQRNGHAYRSKDTFGDDFRSVRAKAFPGDTRQFQDLRRSANVEADVGGVDIKTRGELMANHLASNKFLEETYTPATVSKAREVAAKRKEGRIALEAEIDRIRSKSSA